jgi:CBS domain-containing protein
MESLVVADVMHSPVITVSDEAPLSEAFDLLLQHKISGLVVVDHSGFLVGVISQSDLLRAWREAGDSASLANSSVSQYMTQDVISCAAYKPLTYAMQLLNQHQIHRLVVVESHDGGRFASDRVRPVGVLSQSDIVRALVSDKIEQ